ncbi:hypothetical protein BGZ65_005312 [Modicella reniformis]|uniref:L domain-like protein n=1 Tax=Modicella reniformis TaxID=1440133 RepID=A0A9P6IY25_9FUNG|nr:hypothetical protein BGZ65_005312 [Modicella reniformis]
MGATVSREHAKLPFGYTHARKDDYISTTALVSKRQRLHRLLIRNTDSTSATPSQPHRLQLTEDGIVPGSIPILGDGLAGSFSGGGVLSFMPHSSMDDTDSDDAEIVSLSSILNQGPEPEPQWHAVGQDQDEGVYYYPNSNGSGFGLAGSASAATLNNSSTNTTTTAKAGVPFLQETDSGHESGGGGVAHSRASTLESIAHSDSHWSETLCCSSRTGMGSPMSPSTTAALTPPGAIASTVGPDTLLELVSNSPTLETPHYVTEATVTVVAAHAADTTTALSLSNTSQLNGANQNDAQNDAQNDGIEHDNDKTTKQSLTPVRPRIHPCQHLQKHSFRAIQQDLVETDEDEDTDEDLDDGGNRSKSDRRKMDIISALGIADAPDEGPGDVPFSLFKDEPVFHSLPDQYRLHTTRRNTDGGSYSRSRSFGSRFDHDDYAAVVHLPQDFFEGHRHHFGVGDEEDSDEESDHDVDEDDQAGYPRIRRTIKGKGMGTSVMGPSISAFVSGSHSFLNYPMMMTADEDVGHLNPIPFSELPSLTNIGLCSHGITKLSSNIRLLSSATCLQLCCNDLCSVPTEIGFLRNLTLLDLSKNSLTMLPDSIQYLTKLVDLKLSFNFLESLPTSIGALTKLTSLHLESNRLTRIPSQIGQIKRLSLLELNDNPLTVLPAEIGKLQYLRRLRLDRCPLIQEFAHTPLHSPPTLLELAARVLVRHRIKTPTLLPPHLKSYLKTAQRCSFCNGPYFESSFKRGKIIEKNDARIPLEYTLCIPHWNTEMERVKVIFGPQPVTTPPPPPSASSTSASSNGNGGNNGNSGSGNGNENGSARRHSRSELAFTGSTPLSIHQHASSSSPSLPSVNHFSSSNESSPIPVPSGAASLPLPVDPNIIESLTGNSRVLGLRIGSSNRGRTMGSSPPAVQHDPPSSAGNASSSGPAPLLTPPPSSGAKSRFTIRLKARGERPATSSP